MDRRLRFVYVTVLSMLAIALVLTATRTLTYRLFFVLSYITVLGSSYAFRMHKMSARVRRRILLVLAGGGLVFAGIVLQQILRFVAAGLP